LKKIKNFGYLLKFPALMEEFLAEEFLADYADSADFRRSYEEFLADLPAGALPAGKQVEQIPQIFVS
jgi:hypothetical protein